jgi:hypothetical protein
LEDLNYVAAQIQPNKNKIAKHNGPLPYDITHCISLDDKYTTSELPDDIEFENCESLDINEQKPSCISHHNVVVNRQEHLLLSKTNLVISDLKNQIEELKKLVKDGRSYRLELENIKSNNDSWSTEILRKKTPSGMPVTKKADRHNIMGMKPLKTGMTTTEEDVTTTMHNDSLVSSKNQKNLTKKDSLIGSEFDDWDLKPCHEKPTQEKKKKRGAVSNDILESVLNHGQRGGELNIVVLTKWDCGTQLWTDLKSAYKDASLVVTDYCIENCLDDYILKTKIEIKNDEARLLEKKSSLKNINTKKGKNAEITHMPIILRTDQEKCKKVCNHDRYVVDLTYACEENSKYCSKTGYLFGSKCAICGIEFADKKIKEKPKLFVPNCTSPAYVCHNFNHDKSNKTAGCSHALCKSCFVDNMMMNCDNVGRKSKRSK